MAMDKEREALVRGELWSWLKNVMEQGAAIHQDYQSGKHPTYEHYSARMDAAASERADELAALTAQQEPVAWIRYCSDGTYEGPIANSAIDDVRKKSGVWTPLYTAPPSGVREGMLRAENAAIAGLNHDQFLELEYLRPIFSAAKRLYEEAEEYDFPDGMGQGAPQDYWDALADALEPETPAIEEAITRAATGKESE